MKTTLYILITLLLLVACSTKEKKETFYTNTAGWDIIYIPIVPPFRACSIDKGKSWQITGNELVKISESEYGSIAVQSFGVSDKYIYGSSPVQYSSKTDHWFLFNIANQVYKKYKSEDALNQAIKTLNIAIKPIENCSFYDQQLIQQKQCYWYPKLGSSYPEFK